MAHLLDVEPVLRQGEVVVHIQEHQVMASFFVGDAHEEAAGQGIVGLPGQLGVVVDGEGAIREAAVACQAPEAWYRTDYECLVGTVMFLVAEVLPGLVGMVRAVWIRAEGWNHVIPPSLLRCGRHRRLWIGNMVRGTTKKLYHRHEASPSSKPMDRMRGRDVANNVISKMSM